MSKSRYSKTKAAGAALGLNRNYEAFRQPGKLVPAKNRQMRRLERKK